MSFDITDAERESRCRADNITAVTERHFDDTVIVKESGASDHIQLVFGG